MSSFLSRELEGWGRFPRQECLVARPDKRRGLVDAVQSAQVASLLPRGLGRSYGDSALNEAQGVVLIPGFDRFLDFDPASGLLHAEGGVALSSIIEAFVPRGWFTPVVPGTKFVTLGAAIASDVHGKNHHRVGGFANVLEEFELLLASGETLTCSRTQNPHAFWATIGGLGLTGIILTAKIRLQRIETASILTSYRRTRNLQDTLDGFGHDADTTYSVAWIDCLATGDDLGRSVLIRGEHLSHADWQARGGQGDPLGHAPKNPRAVPVQFPDSVLNARTVRAFNSWYYARHSDREFVEGFEPFFWPLDALGGWNKIYGARGFIQYHCILPFATSREGLTRLLETISSSGYAAFLAVLKLYGPQSDAPLSFPLPGHSLALDIPADEGAVEFARRLDAIVLEHGGRDYLVKDSTMTAATFAQMYPRHPEFARVKRALDPQNRFQSSQSRRLGIGGEA